MEDLYKQLFVLCSRRPLFGAARPKKGVTISKERTQMDSRSSKQGTQTLISCKKCGHILDKN
jgi:hypothetical protein